MAFCLPGVETRLSWWAACAAAWLATACEGVNPSSPSSPEDARGDAGSITEDAGSVDAGADMSDAGSDGGMEATDLAEICGGKAPVTFDDWEGCFERRSCEWQVGCQSLNGFRDVDDCRVSADAVSGGRLAHERRERKRAIDQGRSGIDVAAFTQCLIRTSATRCNTALYDPACLTRFAGTVADGGGCYTAIDCRSPDAACSVTCSDPACCLGTCTPKGREGELCTTFRSCEPGLNCNATCIAGDIGTPCRDSVDCDPEAWCDLEVHRCKPTLPAGAECTDVLQCGGDTTCVGLSIASTRSGRCLRNSRPGDPCDELCQGNRYCAVSSKAMLGECRDLPVLHEPCSPLVPCAGSDTLCREGTCVLRSDVGASCDHQTCLPGLFCTSALGDPAPRCAARGGVNAPCNDPGVCLAWREMCPAETGSSM